MCGLIVRLSVVPRRTVGGDIDRRFDKQTLMMTSAQVVETPANVIFFSGLLSPGRSNHTNDLVSMEIFFFLKVQSHVTHF